jgi:hypothetical protein
MTGRIWSVLVATGLALAVAVLMASTAPGGESAGIAATGTELEATMSPPPAEADAVPDSNQVGARPDRVSPVASFRALLAAALVAVALGVVAALSVRAPDTLQRVPPLARRHVIVSRGPPAVTT